MTQPGNESCPPDQIGGGSQTDLNAPPEATVPESYVQKHNLDQLRPLCQAGMSPAIVTGLIMRTLANHFSSPDLIMTDDLKQYVWAPTIESKIRIVQNTYFDPKAEGLLPALIVKRGDITTSRRALGDLIDSLDPREQDEGTSSYVRFHEGSHRIFCIAETDGEAELLGLEVLDLLTFLSPVMTRYLPFHDFQVMRIGELGVMEDLGNKIAVPLDVTYAYEYAWSVRPIAPRLKSMAISIQ